MFKFLAILSIFSVAFGGIVPCMTEMEEYIVGGKPTNIEEVPYQIALHIGSRFLCGGSILTPTHILTAAHCVTDDYQKITYNIRAGASRWNNGGVFIPAKKVVYHSNFSNETLDYDIAVIELSSPLKFNESIKTIKLADKEAADGEPVKASGWGCLKENGFRPIQLQSVVVPMVNRKTCQQNYKNHTKVTNRMICAGVEGKDTCQGDSGGPLAYKDILVGVVSSGKGCARKDFPGIYTNVADPEIRKFIKEHANV